MWKVIAVMHHHQAEVKRVRFSSGDGRYLATTSADRNIIIYRMSDLHSVQILRGHTDDVFDVRWSPENQFLVSASHDRNWHIWTQTNVNRSDTE